MVIFWGEVEDAVPITLIKRLRDVEIKAMLRTAVYMHGTPGPVRLPSSAPAGAHLSL